MCDGSRNLILWLDGELPGDESAAIEEHVRGCLECREQLDKYKKMSNRVDAYCKAMTSHFPQAWPAWASVVSTAVTAAAIAAVILLLPHKPAERTTAEFPAASVAAAGPMVHAAIPRAAHPPVKMKLPVRPAPAQEPSQAPKWQPAEPTIAVDIPAEAMFAPGAVPDGVHLVAELTIAPDGSYEEFHPGP